MRQAGILQGRVNQVVLVAQASFKPAQLVPCPRLHGKQTITRRYFAAGRWCFNSPVSLEELYSPLAVEMPHALHFSPFSTKMLGVDQMVPKLLAAAPWHSL